MNANQQFWMVYGVGNGQPTYQHECREDAAAEAKRLARQSQSFPVAGNSPASRRWNASPEA